jgi:hypothetical protein
MNTSLKEPGSTAEKLPAKGGLPVSVSLFFDVLNRQARDHYQCFSTAAMKG